MRAHNPGFQLIRNLLRFFTGRDKKSCDSAKPEKCAAKAEPQLTARPPSDISTPDPASIHDKEVFVVWDALGDGRLVGVFKDEAQVKEILQINPFYYRFYRCFPGRPTALALHWLDANGKESLLKVCEGADRQPTAEISSEIGSVTQQAVKKELTGQIREARPDELDRLVEIWLQASLKAHNFISSDFWQTNAGNMRHHYLPKAENWVYEENQRILGFFSLQQNSLAALFVDTAHQGFGIGSRLLNQAKKLRPALALTVYAKNQSGVRFYTHNNFKVVKVQKDPHTECEELLMTCE